MADMASKRNERRLAFIMHLSWITGFAIFVLLMRVWVDPFSVEEDLEALDAQETELIAESRPLPATLKPLAEPLPDGVRAGTFYIPMYRSLYVGDNRIVKKLAATLSIHNTSTVHPLILTRLTYFDGNGEATVERLEAPHSLPPMASAEFYIDKTDLNTATIGSAIVEWSGDASMTPPVVEAIMIGKYGVKGFSVLSRGVSQH